VKTLCQKLIKIDILLSHVKLYKMSLINMFVRAKNIPKKWQPRRQNRPESRKPKTDLEENRPSVSFWFIEN
jgi:hypothetical protein